MRGGHSLTMRAFPTGQDAAFRPDLGGETYLSTEGSVGGEKGRHVPDQPGVRLAIRADEAGIAHVVVEGVLTREGNLGRLRSAVGDCKRNGQVREIRIDLSGVAAIDLQGIGLLLALRDESQRPGIRMTITNPTGSVRARLEQTGTLDYLRGRQPPVEPLE